MMATRSLALDMERVICWSRLVATLMHRKASLLCSVSVVSLKELGRSLAADN